MPANSETILSGQVHPGDSSTETVTGEKFKGDGYYGRADGFHTIQLTVAGFIGTVDIQATLATDPVAADWFTLSGVAHSSSSVDSANASGSFIYNFTGNYVWVRAVIRSWTDGEVSSIILNH